jgi:hypothetical protein
MSKSNGLAAVLLLFLGTGAAGAQTPPPATPPVATDVTAADIRVTCPVAPSR